MKRSKLKSVVDMASNVDIRRRAFLPLLAIASIIMIGLYYFLILGYKTIEAQQEERDLGLNNPFSQIEIEAKGAFVLDLTSGRSLYAKNPDLPLPLASLTKIMTTLTAKKIAPDLDTITIKINDIAVEGDSKLKVASTWNFQDLMDYILLVSSNDGAHAIAGAAGAFGRDYSETEGEHFVRAMNSTAGQLGLTSMSFRTEHGLDTPTKQSGGTGSARDISILFEYTLKNYPDVLEATRYPSLSFNDLSNDIYTAQNTNQIINLIPSPIASKTGYTDLAGGNLVVAFDSGVNRPIIISILGSTQNGRFEDMRKLVGATLLYLKQ
jgi:serine-type D-Ala-D-Ala carboxypeptidase (penicillin-binding protein 5/6)